MSETANLPALRAITNTDPIGSVRTPPHNIEAEQALLGALLVNNVVYEKVGEILQPSQFFDPVHGRIYEAVATLCNRGQIADPKTLRGVFENDPALAGVGGANYLVDLAANVVTIFNVEDYAHLIHDLHLRRELISLGTDIVNDAFQQDLDKPATSQIEGAEGKLFELAQTGEVDRGFVKLEKALTISIKMAEEAHKRDNHITGVTTGFTDMDRRMGGLQRSDLIILAGRPSMGKTALATNIAFNAAHAFYKSEGKNGAGVAFFSLEMSSEQLATRLLGDFASVPSDKIRRGEIKADDFSKFVEASQTMSRCPLYIDDTPGLSVASLRTRARRLKRTAPNLGLIVIDYLQLLHGTGGKREENRVQEVSEITRSLKALAKELNIPVLALSQLSRAVELREDKTPQLADLRESGSIEQDADVVMFVYREEYYHSRSEPSRRPEEDEGKFNDRYARWMQRGEEVNNIAEVIVAKQRHGPIGTVKLHFDGQFTRFSNLENRFGDVENG
ncbi:MAG: replicative DNA helicase [Alphaproteobacteria bacterium]|nr:replicative DNA helicase [Alphaproteobacteria bacterium]